MTSSPYENELAVAIDAAKQSGTVLRDAFNQPGGPSGTLHHADADTHAERVIQQVILDAFPDDGYVGEELGLANVHAPRIWVVDPNDGTSAYMSGFRGSAVSIALLVEDEPVLGVVYAFNYPDDAGDFIHWAHGTPVMRNGEPTQRHWPDAPTVNETVLLSYHADLNAPANADCCTPMRYVSIPSIAYRLALVAVGDGDATVSLQSLSSWDVAAGHAILRGANADVYDIHGTPYRYNHGSLTTPVYAFGGTKTLADHLRKKNWKTVLQRPKRNMAFPLCQSSEAGKVEMGPLSRAQGCMLGQLAGDSLGSLVEFMDADAIRRRYPNGLRHLADGGTFGTIAGQPTDDSEMALILARTLIRVGGFDAKQVRDAYRFWLDSKPFDCGNTIATGLRGNANPTSQANGSMMRVSPLAIFGSNWPLAQVADLAVADATLTHPNPLCLQANALYATAIAEAINTGAEPETLYNNLLSRASAMVVDQPLMTAIRKAADEPPKDFLTSMGWAVIAFQNALYQLLHAATVEEAVVDTVMQGGDTDTNAAICGALLGAVYGRDAIPRQWLQSILRCRPIAGYPCVTQPRPECFWPVDALSLAERLLKLEQTSF